MEEAREEAVQDDETIEASSCTQEYQDFAIFSSRGGDELKWQQGPLAWIVDNVIVRLAPDSLCLSMPYHVNGPRSRLRRLILERKAT